MRQPAALRTSSSGSTDLRRERITARSSSTMSDGSGGSARQARAAAFVQTLSSSSQHMKSPPPKRVETNTPEEEMMVKSVERLRMAMCFAGVFLGHMEYFRLFAALVVFSLAGVTGLESLLMGAASARHKGWPTDSPYQAQSACNNLALALAAAALLLRAPFEGTGAPSERTDAALAAVTSVCLVFIVLSGANHWRSSAGGNIHTYRALGAASLGASAGFVIHKWIHKWGAHDAPVTVGS
mmetsp:Transcript_22922/g.68814  ORF Transcript_22922/g.68814 Transcript_22922/m.68814 type:complete len:240 (+) Transcript_22922:312-1031(+)